MNLQDIQSLLLFLWIVKRALKIFWTIIVAVAALLFAAWILLQTPKVQTLVTKKALTYLEDNLNGRFEFSKIHLRPFNAIVLKDLAVIDNDPPVMDGQVIDTILSAKSFVATFSIKGLFKKEGIHIRRASLKDGSFTLVNELRGNNIKRFLNTKPRTTEKKEMGDLFDIKKLRAERVRFKMVNLKSAAPVKDYGIDWKDLDVMISALEAREMRLSQGYMSGSLNKLSAKEKSGYTIASLSGKTKVGHGETIINDLKLRDNWSDIKMQEFTMSYESDSSFSHFLDAVRMTGVIQESSVAFKSISYFAPGLKDKNIVLKVNKTDFEGFVNDLSINQMDFTETGSGVTASIYGRLTGLPDIKNLVTDLKVDNLSFTTEGIGRLASGFGAKLNLGKFAPGESLTFSGKGSGPVNKLKANGELTSTIGSVAADLRILNITSGKNPVQIGGSFSTKDLDLGKAADIKRLGCCTMRGALTAILEKGQTSVKLDSLFVDRLSALGYDYTDIVAAGTYSENAFDGRIACNDPNLNFLFQGIFTLSDKTRNGLYKFYANIGYADLNALHLDTRGISKVSGQINANYMSISKGDVIGDLSVLNLILENEQGRHEIGNINVESHSNNDINRMNLDSKFADVSFIGTKPLTNVIKDVQQLTLQRELPSVCKNIVTSWNADEYEIRLDVRDARDILSFAVPGMYIADSTRIRMRVTKDGETTVSMKSPRLAMGKSYLKNLNFTFDNKNGSLNGAVSSSELSTSSLSFLNNNIMLYAKDNQVGVGVTYDNETDLADKGEIYLSGCLSRDRSGRLTVRGKTLPSNIYYNGEGWNISSSGINLDGKDVSVENLTASCADQSIRINGGFSSSKKDTLSVELVKFDLGLANKFLKQDFSIEGLATGRALLTSPWKDNAGVMMNLTCDSTKVAGERVGTLRLASALDEKGKMHIIARNDLGGKKTIDLNGELYTKTGELDLTASLDKMNAGYISPVLSTVFSEVGGALSGKVRISGKLKSPAISSQDGSFDNVLLKVAFTNVPYHVNGPYHVSNEGLFFDDMTITDRFSGTGTVSGGLRFNDLKDFRMDTGIKMNGMECLDTNEGDNPSFYGNVFGTGTVNITGPFNAIILDINAWTDKEGNLHIPIDKTSTDNKSDLLTFKEAFKVIKIDPYDLMMNNLTSASNKGSDLTVKIHVNANPVVQAFVEIDKAAGNVLSGRGQGSIDIDVRPNRDLFTINGDYTINNGNFHFNAMNIAQRDFTLSEGSSIRFNGDVMDSDLDINGVYSTKASVATLISDTTSTTTRRAVNCGIGISGKLREPKLDFSIDVPDLDPTTKSKVESALNTDDKVQRQFLSLLISGGFVPNEQSGVVNNTNVLYSNVAEIMAGQLNNILQKLDIPLDLGLNYQSSENGANIFDVAVSTQLFNDRVLVNGAFGNKEYSNSNSNGDVVGDLDIEIKLDKPGQLRLNLFSHSADSYTSYLDNTQRSGVGIAYQKEFNTFKEFFRDLFIGRKKREERMREAAATGEKEVKTIVINDYE